MRIVIHTELPGGVSEGEIANFIVNACASFGRKFHPDAALHHSLPITQIVIGDETFEWELDT